MMDTKSGVGSFYAGKCILLTGATGFLGKVILWKLMKDCPDIGCIYVLVRPAKGISAHQRIVKILAKEPFAGFFSTQELMQKIVPIEGDITMDDLCLSQVDREMLEKNVEVVIHNAASINLSTSNMDNIHVNYYGTKFILNLCDLLKHLKSFVYVGTAYSNCNRSHVEEVILPIKEHHKIAAMRIEDALNGLSDEPLETLLEGRPNTYAYTKALAEHLVSDRKGLYPAAIVRPSLVTPAIKEPYTGWVERNQITPLCLCLEAIGVSRTSVCNIQAKSYLVPVDYVANCAICAAYRMSLEAPNETVVYNMTGGGEAAMTLAKLANAIRERARDKPSTSVLRPLQIQSLRQGVSWPIEYLQLMSEFGFAYTVDTLEALKGRRGNLVRQIKMMHKACTIPEKLQGERTFAISNTKGLADSLNQDDRRIFKFDMTNFDTSEYLDIFYLGIRRFLLGDQNTEHSYAIGRRRYKYATIIDWTLNVFLIYIVVYGLCLVVKLGMAL